MRKALIVIGFQPEKLEKIGRKARTLEDFIVGNQDEYDYIIAITRQEGNRNFMKDGVDIVDNEIKKYYPFRVDTEMRVLGYDVDCKQFSMQTEYHIVGVSTAASVLCTALSMYSAGLNVKVLTDYCFDRKGLDKEAIKIMKAYMGDCLIRR